MTKKDSKNLKLPDQPGVYYFLKGEEILYIGKATSLRSRVGSYFRNDLIETRGPLLVDMVTNADRIWHETTDSVLEALILEANLIKKYQPWANSREKDDKSFNYVCITKEKLPKVILVRGKNLEPKLYKKVFGPYPNGMQLREAIKIVRRIFPFLDDKSKNYLEFYKQINLVPYLKDTKLYLENIRNIILFFSGKKKQIYTNLQKQMKEYAKTREFEKAGEIKRQLFALQHINDVALIKEQKHNFLQVRTQPDHSEKYVSASFRIEAYDIAHMGGENMVGVMTVVENGQVNKNEYRKFKIKTQNGANDTGALKEILERRLAHSEWTYPNLIVMDGGVAQLNAAKKVLVSAGVQIPIVSVLKDERHKPKDILGDKDMHLKYEQEILLANSESHRFAINYHKNIRNRNFLK
jgi:excinuclease ABC subunit C